MGRYSALRSWMPRQAWREPLSIYAHSVGAVLSFYSKGTNVISSATISSTPSNPSLFSSNSFLVNGGGSVSSPQIASLSLSQGPPSVGFVITGTGFGSSQGTVTIGGITAPIVTWTATVITVEVPPGDSTGNVVVTTNGGLPSSGVPFTVNTPLGCSDPRT